MYAVHCTLWWFVQRNHGFKARILSSWTIDDRKYHGRMNYKDTKPYMSAFILVDLLTDFAAFCLTDVIDWRYTHSWFVFSTQLVSCFPPWMGRNYTCVLLSVAPLLYLLSDLLPPPPIPNVQYIQTMCDCGGGGDVLWTMFCRSFTLCFWPDSEPTKLLHRPKQNDQWRRH